MFLPQNEKEEVRAARLLLIMVFIIAIALTILISNSRTKTSIAATPQTTPQEIIKVVIFDGCQYLEWNERYNQNYIHKGNCNNPIHFENKSLTLSTE